MRSKLKLAISCAATDGVPLRSLRVALVVGTILNVINQGDALLSGTGIDWVKVALTYCVPYLVCTYGAVASRLDHAPATLLAQETSHAPRC